MNQSLIPLLNQLFKKLKKRSKDYHFVIRSPSTSRWLEVDKLLVLDLVGLTIKLMKDNLSVSLSNLDSITTGTELKSGESGFLSKSSSNQTP